MRSAWLILTAAVVVGILATLAVFGLSESAGGSPDGKAVVELDDTPTGARLQLDLSDVESAIERVADVRRTAQSQSRVAEDLDRTTGESLRWELETTAFVEGVVFRDARQARDAAGEVAEIGGEGTTVIQVGNVLTLMPTALASGDQRAVGEELRRLRTTPPGEADRV